MWIFLLANGRVIWTQAIFNVYNVLDLKYGNFTTFNKLWSVKHVICLKNELTYFDIYNVLDWGLLSEFNFFYLGFLWEKSLKVFAQQLLM